MLLQNLQVDLRALSAESRKKFPALKEDAERGLMRLREIEENKDLSKETLKIEAIGRADDILQPFLAAIDTRTPKLGSIAVGSLLKLITHGAVAQASVSSIVSKLSFVAQSGDETIHLKVLQALLALESTNGVHGADLAEILCTSFKLQNSKTPAVKNTASATLRQLLAMLFDRTLLEWREQEATEIPENKVADASPSPVSHSPICPPTLRPCAADAFLFLQDISNMTGADLPVWLQLDTISKTFGLELIESILHSHHEVFSKIPEFCGLLQDRICPLVVKTFKLQTDFPCIIRLTRIVSTFIRHFNDILVTESEVFLSRLVKMLDPHNPLWTQTLSLEVFRVLCDSHLVLKSLFVHYDLAHDHKSAKIFQNIVAALGQFVDTMFNWDSVLVVRSSATKTKYIDMLSHADPPSVNESYVVCTALDCLVAIVTGLSELVESTPEERQIAQQMAELSWPTLLASLSLLLDKTNDETIIQEILKSFQLFTKSVGILGLATPRDTFLTSLCNFTLPRNVSTGVTSTNVLSAKNVLAMKTLFNIAHCMGDVLEGGWGLALETFQKLDRLLYTPRGLSQQTGEANTGPSQSSELNVLSSALELLFKSTQHTKDEGLKSVLRALVKISTDSLQHLSNPRVLFGAQKMNETAIHNVHRISCFWPIILEHFLFLSNQKDPKIRTFGVDALTQLVVAALEQKTNQANPAELSSHNGPSALEMQNLFLETLETLAKSSYPDTVGKSLQTLYHILQSSGPALSSSWPLVLSIIMTVAVNNDGPHIPIGFKSAQLVCTDFLPNLTFDCLALYITTLGRYGFQTAELNISLTAINLMMGVADYIALETSKSSEDSSKRTDASAVIPLWENVFLEMKQLAMDQRYEVRICAGQTLFKTIGTHGQILSDTIWNTCLWNILFPFLEKVRVSTTNASTEQFKENAQLMIHHSRNTASKQWSESHVLALSGTARVYKNFYSTLSPLKDFESGWKKLFVELTKSVETTSEVALASLNLLQELLIQYSPGAKYPRNLWECGWECMEKMSESLVEKGNAVPQPTLSGLVKILKLIYSERSSSFSNTDLERLLRILRFLSLHKPEKEGEISSVQASVLALMRQIPLNEEIYSAYIVEILNHISFCIGLSYTNTIVGDNFSFNPATDNSYFAFGNGLLNLLSESFSNGPAKLRTKVFEDASKVVGHSMMSKYKVHSSPLWISAVKSFISIVKIGLVDMNESEMNDIRRNVTWTELTDAIQAFVFHENRGNIGRISPEIMRRDEDLDILLLDLLARDMMSCSAKVPLIHDRFVEILLDGTKLAAQHREYVAQGCYKNLFYLCTIIGKEEDKHSCHMKVAQMVFPALLSKCMEVLKQFIGEDRKQGMPVARSMLAEISFVLNQLSVLEMHPDLDAQGKSTSHGSGKRRHLLKLFPLLCDCITTREDEVKKLLKKIFHQAAEEMGLE